MPKLITTENVPCWAVGYLEYGDEYGYDLTPDEKLEIDEWLRNHFPNGYVCDYHWDDRDDFNLYPLFGKPCDTVKVDFYEP